MQSMLDIRIVKGSYWERVDGSKWWRNPESNRIEPYTPSGKTVPEDKEPENRVVPGKRFDIDGEPLITKAAIWLKGQDHDYFKEFNEPYIESRDTSSGVNASFTMNFRTVPVCSNQNEWNRTW